MKIFMLITFCSVIVCASAYGNYTFQGGPRPTKAYFVDQLVIKNEVHVHNKFDGGSLFDKKFEKTETFTPGHGTRITMIKATDLKKNGASVRIKSGGLGQPSDTLKFENHKHGFHYNVEIYAF